MIKHRLMLSAAAAALLTAALAVSAAKADVTVSTAQTTALTTATSGNITIEQNGGIGIKTSATPAITINSSNTVINQGYISNGSTDGAVGLLIDTTSGNLFPPSTGYVSTGTLDVAGSGSSKTGILIAGGNTFFGPISLTSLNVTAINGVTAANSASSLLVKGDYSTGLYLVQGTSLAGNVLVAGGLIQNASDKSEIASGVMVNMDGTLYGNFINQGSLTGTGPGIRGVQLFGGIQSCANAPNKPSGFSCAASSGGSFVNSGSISVTGIAFPSSRGGNPQSSSAVLIGNRIDGGFLNDGPATASNRAAAVISGSGLAAAPLIWIDPALSATTTTTAIRGPVILGPVTSDIDSFDPGFSFINRGTISGKPVEPQFNATGLLIQGSSATNYTCFSASVGACTGTNANPQLNTGGLLNTGLLAVEATTSQQTVSNNSSITATALYVGANATVPRINVTAQTVNSSTSTQGAISALVSGVGPGRAYAILIDRGATVPAINISQNAQVIASVTTNTTSPAPNVATSSAPFILASTAIVDNSSTLKLVNNAGKIVATNTTLVPPAGSFTASIQRALDLQNSNTTGVTINNSGQILGDVLMPSVGSGGTIRVGNFLGAANPGTGIVNTPTNYAVIAAAIVGQTSGQPPVTQAALLDFGADTSPTLNVGGFGYVNADIRSNPGSLNVRVENNGILYVANSGSSVQANTFLVDTNGTLGLSISQSNANSTVPVVQANSASVSGANLALQFGGFISSGYTAASTESPTAQTITLIRTPAGQLTDTTLDAQNASLSQNIPFLFQASATPLSKGTSGGQDVLQITLTPRSTNAFNANGTPGLNLSGEAKQVFPFAASALATDPELGAAVARSATVYNTPGVPTSGINIPASQQQAQLAFSQFAPDVSGGVREVAILITDQASGPVAARQRLLRTFSKQPGEMTLWGEEFAGHINNKGRTNGAGTLTSFKDHGWGFAIGVDGGSPRNGWYGGAFTFYTGDVAQVLPRLTKTETQWYMLSGYTHWQGKRLFLDTTLSAAYGDLQGNRGIAIGGVARDALSKRATQMVALGGKTGMMLNYGGIRLDPNVSLDGLTLREEGYTETGGGSGFNLQVAPYYANSLRAALGADLHTSVSVWGIDLSPEARVGYRYDLLTQAVKIKAGFASTGGLGTVGNTTTFVGPDPDSGNTILGLGLGANTDTWQLGVRYDWIRGNNGSTTQVGTFTVLGRI